MSVKKAKTIRTMREVWDERSKKDLEELAKQKECFLEHLKRKKMVMDFFPEYYAYLNEAGFNKI